MRALLDLMHKNEAAVESLASGCEEVLQQASTTLMVLDPEVGEEELIKAVAVQLAKVRRMAETSNLH